MRSLFPLVVVALLPACPPASLVGEACTADDPQDPCEGRAQLHCDGQVYVLLAACSADCAGDDVPLISHDREQIDSDTTWTCEEGAHVVTGTVDVGPGATLTIAPGAAVRLDLTSHIDVDPAGRVVVDATDFAPVIMTSNNGQSAGFGTATSGGLNVFATEGEPSILRHLIIERGIQGLGVFALSSTANTPIIQNSTFRDNENFGIKVTCDELDFAVPDFAADCTGDNDVPCGNSFFENKAGDVSPCE
jgi:hypothetical protein